MVFGQINDKLARDVVAQILTLTEGCSKPIQTYVNSPGGHVESGDTIHDIIKFVGPSVPIYMIGKAVGCGIGARGAAQSLPLSPGRELNLTAS
jgi:ATP-dependent Clp protease protease subunit